MTSPGKTAVRSSGYNKKALAQIRDSLLPFESWTGRSTELPSAVGSEVNSQYSSASATKAVQQHSANHSSALKFDEDNVPRTYRNVQSRLDVAGALPKPRHSLNGLQPSNLNGIELENDCQTNRSDIDSGAGSIRSTSPWRSDSQSLHAGSIHGQSLYSFCEVPPPPPPRCQSNVPVPLLKRLPPPPPLPPTRSSNNISVSRKPMIVRNGPKAQQQLTQQIRALNIQQSLVEIPHPTIPPPPYPEHIQNKRSSIQSQECRSSPSSGIYSEDTSALSSSPISSNTLLPHLVPIPSVISRQAVRPVIVQSVRSTHVEKPVLQTAIAPMPKHITEQPPPPPYDISILHMNSQNYPSSNLGPAVFDKATIPTTAPPTYAATMLTRAAQVGKTPNYQHIDKHDITSTVNCHPRATDKSHFSENCNSCIAENVAERNNDKHIHELQPKANATKISHHSPIPERRKISKDKEDERRDCKVKNYSPQAFKFFMEQHIENVFKSYKQRNHRRMQLEREMNKIGLTSEIQEQMRKLLSQKESNYIRLKRAKMDKSMFQKIKIIGAGAFGEVSLVRKIDTNYLYAMKTLRKADVLKRNQVAHVKAERDILAEADIEWVVKLYYTFQDKDFLYFIMDYIPGGDLMSLLIKLGIFDEVLAKFYIAELTCAVESVHKMGFIHRDIKPDNILIDRAGHIKLTDFGLCTGFRWTHDSKYYQNDHDRQDSTDAADEGAGFEQCECRLKPLERRRQRALQRCSAHSLVGTPNYIAPEVLQRCGYTQLCDWWSVGVILYEMLVGAPPFAASTPAETQFKIINWERTLSVPATARLSSESEDLILRLCCAQENRMGRDVSELKNHPFFLNIDFEKDLRRQPAPYVPKIEHATDTSNFDAVETNGRWSGSSNKSVGEGARERDTFHGFFEFTFRRFFDEGAPHLDSDLSVYV